MYGLWIIHVDSTVPKSNLVIGILLDRKLVGFATVIVVLETGRLLDASHVTHCRVCGPLTSANYKRSRMAYLAPNSRLDTASGSYWGLSI